MRALPGPGSMTNSGSSAAQLIFCIDAGSRGGSSSSSGISGSGRSGHQQKDGDISQHDDSVETVVEVEVEVEVCSSSLSLLLPRRTF